ncbi:unnamed protein product, partial [Ixodes persulcatus]
MPVAPLWSPLRPPATRITRALPPPRRLAVLLLLCCVGAAVGLVSGGRDASSSSASQASQEEEETPAEELLIAGFFPTTANLSEGAIGRGVVPAVNLALRHINSSPHFLPGYRLDIIWNDTQV